MISSAIAGFLGARDLLALAQTCRFLQVIADDAQLWQRLLFLDFFGEVSTADVIPESHGDETSSVTSLREILPAKNVYMKKVRGFERRARLVKIENQLNEKILSLCKRRALAEKLVRWFSLEFTTPLFGICPLLTFLFIGFKLDGRLNSHQTWVLLAPLVFLMVVLCIGVALGALLFLRRNVASSFFFGMYHNFRGFVQFWMHKVFHENPVALCSGLVIFINMFVFFILVGYKITSSTYPEGFTTWANVFIPFWIDFIIFAMAPLLRWGGTGRESESFRESYCLLLGTLWLPLFAFCVVLPLWLDKIIVSPFQYILVPLMVVQAEFLLFPILTLIQSLYTRKDISDSLLVVFVMCLIFTPLVVFEVLLAVHLNDITSSQLSFVKVFSPLVLWFSLTTCMLINFLIQYNRPSQPALLSPSHPLVLKKNNVSDSSSVSSPPGHLSRAYSRRLLIPNHDYGVAMV